MANKGITQEQVHRAADALLQAGERPTVDRIRAFLGTGSPNTVTRMLEGAPVRGAETTLELDETRFASIGDAHLFGLVLDELLATYCSINSFHELRVRLHPSKIEFRWDPRNGHHRIL